LTLRGHELEEEEGEGGDREGEEEVITAIESIYKSEMITMLENRLGVSREEWDARVDALLMV
jgi:hypothetical protein